MTENELASVTVDCCFKVHTSLGPGLLESVYEAALAYELMKRNIPFERQVPIAVVYENEKLDLGFRADFAIDNKLIVELKSIDRIDKVHHKQVLTYLKLSGIKLGLLVNFNVELIKDGIHRKIYGQLL